MARTRRKDRHIACLNSQRPSLRSFELHLAAAARDAVNFVNARMAVNIWMPSRHESAHPLLSNIRRPGRVTRYLPTAPHWQKSVSFPTARQDPSREPEWRCGRQCAARGTRRVHSRRGLRDPLRNGQDRTKLRIADMTSSASSKASDTCRHMSWSQSIIKAD
jgi:hypothetical protein